MADRSNLVETYVEGFHGTQQVSKMKYNRLGKTAMNVSILGLGTSSFGGGFGPMQLDECCDILEMSLKAGINYIDTAPWYGSSEERIGEALAKKGIPRQCYYVSTKVGRYFGEPLEKRFDFTAERILKSIDDSLRKLGVKCIDLVQVHDMEFAPSLDIILHQTLPALQKAKEAGKLTHIGITGYPLENFKTILESSTVQIDTILTYAHYSLYDISLNDYIDYFKSKGIGIINGSPTGMGLLTNQGPPKWHPGSKHTKDVCCSAASYAKEQGTDIAKLALKFSTNNQEIDTTLVSASKFEYMKSNIETVLSPLNEKEEYILTEVNKRYFTPQKNSLSWEGLEVKAYKENLLKKTKSL